MDNDVIDLTTPAKGWDDPGRWRTNLAIGLAIAFILVCTAVTLTYRHEHRDEWTSGTTSWQSYDVSSDGRTLTFHAVWVSSCSRISGVDFSTDPTAGGALTATLETRTQTVRDGHPVFCSLGMSVDGTPYRVELDGPVPDGTVITDGASHDTMLPCGRRSQQVVRAPTRIDPVFSGCPAIG